MSDKFLGAWLVSEYVYNPDGSFAGIVRQRRELLQMDNGRSLCTSQHFYGEALKIRGREFLIDDDFTMSIVWDWLASDKRQTVSFGLLKWEQGEQVLKASY